MNDRAGGSGPRRLAVLGGGASALTAVFELTRRDNWQQDFDITVYQLGWRLGGKGASGRNPDPEYFQRIEEHGVHVFFGFYANAFDLMQQCYAELARPPGSTLRNWDDAFKGHRNIVIEEQMPDGRSFPWQFTPPTLPGIPGSAQPRPRLSDYVMAAVSIIESVYDIFVQPDSADAVAPEREGAHNGTHNGHHKIGDLIYRAADLVAERTLDDLPKLIGNAKHIAQLVRDAGTPQHAGKVAEFVHAVDRLDLERLHLHELLQAAANDVEEFILTAIAAVVRHLRIALALIWYTHRHRIQDASPGHNERCRLAWIIVNYTFANVNGAFESHLFTRGIEEINHFDYRDWIAHYAFNDGGITRDSALIRWLYDAVFAYRGGDVAKPSLEAGTAFLTVVRLLFDYHGDFVYKMQAGMGDVIFAPLYEVLKRRGVKFRFFHRVTALRQGMVDGKSCITGIDIERQVGLGTADAEYQPLVDVHDREGGRLPCWPSAPDYAQIAHGAEIKAWLEERGWTLESYVKTPYTEVLPRLERGRDFDHVLLGISLGALPFICADLAAAPGNEWASMMGKVGTVRTQAFQLWLNRPLAELVGAKPSPLAEPAIVCGYDYDADPVDSYADMHQTLAREAWPKQPGAPQDIAYFCSFMRDLPEDGKLSNPSPGDEQAKKNALELLRHRLDVLWPAVCKPGLDWNVLVDFRATPGVGEKRFDAQYWVSIQNPSDRYVLSLIDSSRYRMWANRSGYDNLVVAGDWARNTLNLGCAESAVMSGRAAANALRGVTPISTGITGWGMFCRDSGP